MELLMTYCTYMGNPVLPLLQPRPHSPFQQSENSDRDGMAREEKRIAKRGK